MNPTVRYVAEPKHVEEVSLRGTADLPFWQDRLKREGLVPAERQGRAQVLIYFWILSWLSFVLLYQSLTAADLDPSFRILFRGEAITELAPHGTGNIYAPSVVLEGDLWRMWYGGQGKDGHDRIHYAESRNSGRSWTKCGLALENGSANHVNDPSVLRVDGKWFMFYTVAEQGTEDAIALATSSDGLKWEKKGVVLQPGPKGSWDSRLLGRPSVLHENGQFRMWYDGQPTKEDRPAAKLEGARAVGLATSPDGVHWQRHSANPVFQQGAGAVDVARVEKGYLLLYEGHTGVGAAVSGDGVVWKVRGLVTHLSGSDSDRYGQVTPHLVHAGNAWQIFFGAANRKTWDGNIMAVISLSAVPPIGEGEAK
ncbi:MAG: hypothetical protein JWM16_1705 [Verrucomicrobiales bacterium]|nr:hypothetical protein [Verrucomicrobiales bacterium]